MHNGTELPDKPEVSQPEVSKPEVIQPEVRRPEVSQPEVRQPEVQQQEVRQPELQRPEIRRPEVRRPEVRQPEVRRPEVRRPEVRRPEVRRPEVRRPDIDDRGRWACGDVPNTSQVPAFARRHIHHQDTPVLPPKAARHAHRDRQTPLGDVHTIGDGSHHPAYASTCVCACSGADDPRRWVPACHRYNAPAPVAVPAPAPAPADWQMARNLEMARDDEIFAKFKEAFVRSQKYEQEMLSARTQYPPMVAAPSRAFVETHAAPSNAFIETPSAPSNVYIETPPAPSNAFIETPSAPFNAFIEKPAAFSNAFRETPATRKEPPTRPSRPTRSLPATNQSTLPQCSTRLPLPLNRYLAKPTTSGAKDAGVDPLDEMLSAHDQVNNVLLVRIANLEAITDNMTNGDIKVSAHL